MSWNPGTPRIANSSTRSPSSLSTAANSSRCRGCETSSSPAPGSRNLPRNPGSTSSPPRANTSSPSIESTTTLLGAGVASRTYLATARFQTCDCQAYKWINRTRADTNANAPAKSPGDRARCSNTEWCAP